MAAIQGVNTEGAKSPHLSRKGYWGGGGGGEKTALATGAKARLQETELMAMYNRREEPKTP